MPPLENFDHASFWEQSDYADKEYVEAPPTAATLADVEAKLGYQLPAAYVELSAHQNGGIPRNSAHRMTEPTCWAPDHVAIDGIHSIGSDKPYSLCGYFGSRFWVDEWEYPDIGVYFAGTPSGGHEMLCLDYRSCGPTGEPTVVHVDQEGDYKITLVAPSFEAFIRSLVNTDEFDLDV